MTRLLRLCDVCGGLDDHPRHVTSLAPGSAEGEPSKEFLDSLAPGAPISAIAELLKPNTIVRHMDCCAANGCELCAETEITYGGRRGQGLIDHLAAMRGSNG